MLVNSESTLKSKSLWRTKNKKHGNGNGPLKLVTKENEAAQLKSMLTLSA